MQQEAEVRTGPKKWCDHYGQWLVTEIDDVSQRHYAKMNISGSSVCAKISFVVLVEWLCEAGLEHGVEWNRGIFGAYQSLCEKRGILFQRRGYISQVDVPFYTKVTKIRDGLNAISNHHKVQLLSTIDTTPPSEEFLEELWQKCTSAACCRFLPRYAPPLYHLCEGQVWAIPLLHSRRFMKVYIVTEVTEPDFYGNITLKAKIDNASRQYVEITEQVYSAEDALLGFEDSKLMWSAELAKVVKVNPGGGAGGVPLYSEAIYMFDLMLS